MQALLACPSGTAVTTDAGTTSAATTGGDETVSVPTTGEGPPLDVDDSYFLLAHLNDEPHVVRVSPTNGTVEPFGPALPVELLYPGVAATEDHANVIVVSTDTMLSGNGSAWKVHNLNSSYSPHVADDAELVWFDAGSVVDNTAYITAWVVSPVGEVVFTGEPANPLLSWRGFGPGGAWFAFRDYDRGLVLRKREGQEAVVPYEYVHLAFANSAIVRADTMELKWFDLSGQPLAVPGFVASSENVARNGYQVAGGVLSELRDGEVHELQQVPPDMPPDVVGHVEGVFAIGRLAVDAPYATIGLDGAALSQLTPVPDDAPPPQEFELDVASIACLACPTRSILLALHERILDDTIPFANSRKSVQMWSLDAQGHATGPLILRSWADVEIGSADDFHYSADGSHVVWTEDGGLQRLNVGSGAITAIEQPYVIDD